MVTAGAALERDMASPNTLLGCPGHLDVGQRVVPNYGGFDLGVVPMSRAFASSCNTTFAQLASQMPPRGLTQAANKYGMGLDYQIDGLSTVTGSVPPTVDLAERTEDGFGQGKVLASPFGMAMVAATVAAGKAPIPKLIEGRPTTITGDTTPISEKMIEGLRPMMRLVVTNGTAKEIAGCGEVYGKTGEAEFPGGSHSWFAGYRGDLAFASLIVGGGSSEYAVRMTKFMFESCPLTTWAESRSCADRSCRPAARGDRATGFSLRRAGRRRGSGVVRCRLDVVASEPVGKTPRPTGPNSHLLSRWIYGIRTATPPTPELHRPGCRSAA